MATQDYQETDLATVRAWLADATLGTSLDAIFTWDAWYGPGEQAAVGMVEPVFTDDGLPRGCGFYRVEYPNPVTEYHGGDAMPRRAQIAITWRRQPSPLSTYWDDILSARTILAQRLEALVSSTEVDVMPGEAFNLGLVNGWQEAGVFYPVWME